MLVRKENKIYRVVEDEKLANLRNQLMSGVNEYMVAKYGKSGEESESRERYLNENNYSFFVDDKDGDITMKYKPLSYFWATVKPEYSKYFAKDGFRVKHSYRSNTNNIFAETIKEAVEIICEAIEDTWNYEDEQY